VILCPFRSAFGATGRDAFALDAVPAGQNILE
jgi:hypothetical protein